MNTSGWLVSLAGVAALVCGRLPMACAQPAASPKAEQSIQARPTPSQPEKTLGVWESRGCVDDARGQWFRDAKFGAFIHFGLYSHLGGYYQGKGPYRPAEQIMGLGDRRAVISAAEYKANVAAEFNPAKFDAAKWVDLMKKAGQKYVILTAKHHDGFCMFKTATTPFNVVDATPFGRDLVKEVAEECRRQGLEFCIYYSIGDWTAKDVQGPGFAEYKEYMQAQLKELLTNYGDVKALWFDNFWYVENQWSNDEAHAEDLYTFVRSVRPGVLVNDRCGRGSESSDGDYATPENQLRGSLQKRYFEVVMTNTEDDNWGWVKGATNYRSAGDLVRNLIDCASKGGNFVLNVGPNADGEFPPEHMKILEAMGQWTATNGEAVYGTVPAPEVSFRPREGTVCYATKAKDSKTYYVHVVEWPEHGFIEIQGLPVTFKGSLVDTSLGKVKAGLEPTKTGDRVGLYRPTEIDPYATVVRFSAPTTPDR